MIYDIAYVLIDGGVDLVGDHAGRVEIGPSCAGVVEGEGLGPNEDSRMTGQHQKAKNDPVYHSLL